MNLKHKLLGLTILSVFLLYISFVGSLFLKPEFGFFLPLIVFVFSVLFVMSTLKEARDELKVDRQHEWFENPLLDYWRIRRLLAENGRQDSLLLQLRLIARVGFASALYFGLMFLFFFLPS